MRLTAALLMVWLSLPVAAEDYFPPPDTAGGWRVLESREAIRRVAGVDAAKLDEAFSYIQRSTKNGGLLVARRGWLIYERYFGLGNREATPNSASVGKSFTSVAIGILLAERPDRFPEGLDQRVFIPAFMPPVVFPLTDARKSQIRLGQLLTMTAGIRGNNPGVIRGRETVLDPEGPDGWEAMTDRVAAGRTHGKRNTRTLWVRPGGGYSYATASVHLASMMLRRVTGVELADFIARTIAEPLGWGRWGFGYQRPEMTHTPGGGGIALRATDMLRFTYLLLRGGRWEDRQIVPEEYVSLMGKPSPYNPHTAYSLQFHVNTDSHVSGAPIDAYWKPGSGGHCIYVVPSLDLVIYKMGGRDGQYSPAQLDVPAPVRPLPGEDGSRDDWSASVDAEAAVRGTLERVVAAVLTDAAR